MGHLEVDTSCHCPVVVYVRRTHDGTLARGVVQATGRLPSHGHVVTRSTRHTRVSSHSQLVTSEHITKPPVVIFLSERWSGSTQKQCSTRTVYLTASMQYRSHWRRRSSWMGRTLGQKGQSTRHNTIRHDGQLVTRWCDELTVWRVDWFPTGQTTRHV